MMTDQEIFRKKAGHYLVCFANECPRHEHCLRWLTGQEYNQEDLNALSVNPRNAAVLANRCTMYRENKKVRYAKGMMHIFYDMPHHIEMPIKQHLIHLFSRKRFYEYRNGTRLISPEIQETIARIFKEKGWTAAPKYDGWEEDYQW